LNGLDLTGVGSDVLVLGSRRSQHLDEGLLVGTDLIDLNGDDGIALCLEYGDCRGKLLLAQAHVKLVAETHVDHTLLINLILEEGGSRLENVLLGLIRGLKEVSHRRLGNADTLTDGDVGPTLLLQTLGFRNIRLLLGVLLDSLSGAQLSGGDSKVSPDPGPGHTSLLQLINNLEEVLASLIGIVSRTPRISTRPTNDTDVVQLLQVAQSLSLGRITVRDLVGLRKIKLDLLLTIPESDSSDLQNLGIGLSL